ncbi:MAG: hypothetical protein KatS3mg002_1361 [Candidatus Woesearchaeota archaeon]|nr:MAG: hypothetical protein KatS3mg002_1361 [Candidatus Woesearchaeota archaeon]
MERIKYKKEEVKWVDCHSLDQWRDPEVEELYIITTIGFNVYEDETQVQIASSVGADNQCACTMVIPKTAIRYRKKL